MKKLIIIAMILIFGEASADQNIPGSAPNAGGGGSGDISGSGTSGQVAEFTGTKTIAGTSTLDGLTIAIDNGDNPTLDAIGEVALDTTDNQLLLHDTAVRTYSYKNPVCVTLEDLAAADDNYTFWAPDEGVTVIQGWCNYRGTGTTPATIDFEDGNGNKMTMTDMTCAASTAIATPQTISAANQLTARELIAFDVTNAVNPETDEYTICFVYTIDRQ